MAHPKYSQDEIIEGLNEVFRQAGFEGASMESLAESAGLKKSSLYHRFPKGKVQMAEEVLAATCQWIKNNMVDIVHRDIPNDEKLDLVMTNLYNLYDGGRNTCILRSMSMAHGITIFEDQIAQAFSDWHYAFKQIALGYGKNEEVADRLAKDGIIRIQGSLILSKSWSDTQLFQETISEIETEFKA